MGNEMRYLLQLFYFNILIQKKYQDYQFISAVQMHSIYMQSILTLHVRTLTIWTEHFPYLNLMISESEHSLQRLIMQVLKALDRIINSKECEIWGLIGRKCQDNKKEHDQNW